MISRSRNGELPVVALMTLLALLPVTAVGQALFVVSRTDEKSGQKRFGFIDKNGRLVIDYQRLPKTVRMVGEFRERRAIFSVGGRQGPGAPGDSKLAYGYLDETGRVAIAARFDYARGFSEGLAYVEAEDFRGYIDREGKRVIEVHDYRVPSYFVNDSRDFHEGLAAIGGPGRGDPRGYIDRSGRLVIERSYSFAARFSEGLAAVQVEDRYGFIDKAGRMVIPPRFVPRFDGYTGRTVALSRFSEGLARVRADELYGYIDNKGAIVIPAQFESAQDFSEGRAWVVTRNPKKIGWIDAAGRWVVTGANGQAFPTGPGSASTSNEWMDWSYSEGLAPFISYSGDTVLLGYLDRNGKIAVPPRELSYAGRFAGGIAKVTFFEKSVLAGGSVGYKLKDGYLMPPLYAYIDKTGRIVWGPGRD
jgi:hypothetical protein